MMNYLSPASRLSLEQFLDEVFKSIYDGNVSPLDCLRVAFRLWQLIKSFEWVAIDWEELADLTQKYERLSDSVGSAGKTADGPTDIDFDAGSTSFWTGSNPPVVTGDEHASHVNDSK